LCRSLPNGKAYESYLLREVKSFITQPSPGLTLKEPGLYEITGLAYSGAGRILEGDGFGRWQQKLGGGGATGAGAEQSLHSISHAMALGWLSHDPTKPCVGRGW
jgi:hypothetical protein